MSLRRRVVVLLAVPALAVPLLAAHATADGPPRPGCGFGDTNHNHQAAPGRDPKGLRPGNSTSDRNHTHTAPPGQAPDDGGQPGNPRRGCPADPRS